MVRRRIDDWTVGAVLEHLAFWDQSRVVRWDQFAREGAFVRLTGEAIDLVNDTSLPTWRALPGEIVAALVLQADEAALAV